MGHGGLRRSLPRSVAFPVDDGLAEAADGVAEVDGVGAAQVFDGEGGLMRVGVRFEDVAAVDAGEQAAIDWWRVEAAGFLDEDVVDGGFGDLAALVQEEDFVEAGLGCGLESIGIEGAMGGFVEVHRVRGIGVLGSDSDAEGVG